MDKLLKLKLFAKVVETHSFTTAAKQLGMSRTSASKAIAELEQDLKANLLHRSTRHVSTTQAGTDYYQRIQAILSELQEAEEAIHCLQSQARGQLRINMPLSFGLHHMTELVTDFMALHPDLHVETHMSDRFVDPIEEGYDCTLRIADLSDSSLISRKLAPIERTIVASPEYLDQAGIPKHPKELSDHCCLHYGNLSSGTLWQFSHDNKTIQVRINGHLCSNNAEILRVAALKGQGITFLPNFMIEKDLQAGRLVPLLQNFALPPLALYALTAPGRHQTAKIRLFLDFLYDAFATMRH